MRLKRDVEDLERFKEIMGILVEEGCGYFLDRLNLLNHLPLSRKLAAKRHSKPGPERLKKTIERLGPTFIKFGQIMAERPDVVPPRYTEKLQELQDDAPSFSPDKAREIVDEETGLENFEDFQKEPIAAASIAQVHRARLDGQEVIVKIRRPGIRKKVEQDLDIMKYLARKGEKHSENLSNLRITDLVEEFARWTRNELDLEKEARNAQIFRENMKEQENIYVPEVFPKHSTEKVLIMEYVEGVKATQTGKLDEMNISKEKLASTAIKAGLKQVVVDGFFHADPHPSNFLIREDGSFVYLDFGMMGQIPDELRDKIDLMLIHGMKENSDKLFEILKDIGRVEKDADLQKVRQEVNRKVLILRNSTLSEASISKQMLELVMIAGRNGIHMPTCMTLMGKNLITMEGIGLKVCPNFKPTEEYREYGEKLLKEKNSPEDLAENAMLDIVENKDLLENPVSSIRNSLEDQQKTPKVTLKQEKSDLLPPALILSSAPLMIGSYLFPPLLAFGTAELVIGLYLHLQER